VNCELACGFRRSHCRTFPYLLGNPVVAPQAVALRFETSTADPSPGGATVLLVDDEAALVHAIGEFLRESGYLVLDAFSSQDALDLAKEHPRRIDVLITDVIMPGLQGPDLHRQIIELQPKIQVRFMSGYAEGLPEIGASRGSTIFAEAISIFRTT